MVAGVTGSVKGRELAWKFVQKNWAEFVSRYQGGFLLPRVIKCVTENFVTEDKAKEVEVSGRRLSVVTREGSCYRGSSNVSQKTLSLRTKLRKLR